MPRHSCRWTFNRKLTTTIACHMPPISSQHKSRVIYYHQTFHNNGQFVSALPIVTEAEAEIPVTHLIIAAIHVNAAPGDVTLNDDPHVDPKFDDLWEEVGILQDLGIKVLGMLGGAAQGSFQRLDQDSDVFESFYVHLADMIRMHKLDGLDLDVEEEMSLSGIIRLIDRLKSDFGPGFIITMAPVATALRGGPHLSGFDYEALEVMRGSSISWYNTQFYNNWGRLDTFLDFDAILQRGWKPDKVVVGVPSSPRNGNGYVEFSQLKLTLSILSQFYEGFGGIFAWEYYNALPGDEARPWEWAQQISQIVGQGKS